MTAIYVFAKWEVKDGNLDTVLDLLKEIASHSRKEEGNLLYMVSQNQADPNTILLFEGYANQDALDNHRNTEHFQSLVIGKVVPLLKNREVMLASPLHFN